MTGTVLKIDKRNILKYCGRSRKNGKASAGIELLKESFEKTPGALTIISCHNRNRTKETRSSRPLFQSIPPEVAATVVHVHSTRNSNKD